MIQRLSSPSFSHHHHHQHPSSTAVASAAVASQSLSSLWVPSSQEDDEQANQ